MARENIYDEWTKATDPAELAPKVPRILREAGALLRKAPPDGMPREELTQLIDALEAPYRHASKARSARRWREKAPMPSARPGSPTR